MGTDSFSRAISMAMLALMLMVLVACKPAPTLTVAEAEHLVVAAIDTPVAVVRLDRQYSHLYHIWVHAAGAKQLLGVRYDNGRWKIIDPMSAAERLRLL